jgi:DNA-directed RNA polymerase specialized sigma subunit
MNDIEISIIRSWLEDKTIAQIAKELDIYQSQVAEILEKALKRLNQIPKTYKTDEYGF